MFDIAEQMLEAAADDEDGVLLDAFVLERIHLGVKAYAAGVHSKRRFEASVLERTTTDKLATLQTMNSLKDHLNEPVEARGGDATARSCEIGLSTFATGDIVASTLYDGKVAVICKCVMSVNGSIWLDVRELNVLRRFSTTSLLIDKTNMGQNIWRAQLCYGGLAWYNGRSKIYV